MTGLAGPDAGDVPPPRLDWSRVAVVTACDEAYADLAEGLLRSIHDAAATRGMVRPPPLFVLDLGLAPESRARLARLATIPDVPLARLPIDHLDVSAGFALAHLVKAFLPDYLPGHDTYVWLDADAWVQDWRALLLVVVSARQSVAVVPEIDRGYRFLYQRRQYPKLIQYAKVRRAFGAEVARALDRYPILNTGVVAAAAGSPLWAAWQEELATVYAKAEDPEKLSDQAAFNVAVYQRRLRFTPLPASANWIFFHAVPRLGARLEFLEPFAPFPALGICHLTQRHARRELTFRHLDGSTRVMRPDYLSVRAARLEAGIAPDRPAPARPGPGRPGDARSGDARPGDAQPRQGGRPAGHTGL